MLLLLLACFTADPAAEPDFASYFAEHDRMRNASIKEAQTKVIQLDAAITNEPLRQRKGLLKAELLKAEKAVERAEAATYRPHLLSYAEPRMVGYLLDSTVVAIVNDTTAIIAPRKQDPLHAINIVITGIETKDLRVRKPFTSDQLWHVTATDTKDKALKQLLTASNPYDVIKQSGDFYIVAPLTNVHVATARIAYDKKQKAQVKAQ